MSYSLRWWHHAGGVKIPGKFRALRNDFLVWNILDVGTTELSHMSKRGIEKTREASKVQMQTHTGSIESLELFRNLLLNQPTPVFLTRYIIRSIRSLRLSRIEDDKAEWRHID